MTPNELSTGSNEQESSDRVPAVTVLMSTYNGVRYIDQAIRSILRQTWRDFEFLIIDDASTDRTVEIIESYHDHRICLLRNETNLGVTRSLNRGLASAHGALVAIQDHDDVSHPERLSKQVEFMAANPDMVLAGAQARLLNSRGRRRWRPGWWRPLSPESIRFQSMFDNPFIHSTIIFRREVIWNEFGGYDEKYATGHDYDLVSRVAQRHLVRNLPEKLFDYRVHDDALGKRYGTQHSTLTKHVVKRNLCAYLKRANVPDEWTHLITSLHINDKPSAGLLERFSVVAEEIYEEFLESNPEERKNREIQNVLAAKLSQIACLLARTHRRDAVAAMLRAGRLNAVTVLAFVPKLLFFLSKRERPTRFERGQASKGQVD